MLTAIKMTAAPAMLISILGPAIIPARNQAPMSPYAATALKSQQPTRPGFGNHGDLTQRLYRSHGRITPPSVDRGMTKMPPNTGSMPVIRPDPKSQ
jgi:hypothetical protein